MAFTSNNSNQNNDNNTSSKNDNWKAVGFINVYLPSQDGGRVKLGAIPLKAGKPREKTLAEWLAEDDEAGTRLQKVVNSLTLEYQSAEPSDAKGFALE